MTVISRIACYTSSHVGKALSRAGNYIKPNVAATVAEAATTKSPFLKAVAKGVATAIKFVRRVSANAFEKCGEFLSKYGEKLAEKLAKKV